MRFLNSFVIKSVSINPIPFEETADCINDSFSDIGSRLAIYDRSYKCQMNLMIYNLFYVLF